MQVDKQLIVEEARKWLGVRWHHQGRSEAGIDCVGLVIRVAEAVGITYPDMVGYKRVPNGAAFVSHIRSLSRLSRDPQPGDVGIFKDTNYPCHVGIFGLRDSKLSIIHAYAGAGKVVEDFIDETFLANLIEAREIIKLDENDNG